MLPLPAPPSSAPVRTEGSSLQPGCEGKPLQAGSSGKSGKEQIIHLLLLLVASETDRGLLAGIHGIKLLALLSSVLPKMSLGQPALPTGKHWSE